ncbi:MAG TPA: riboflavin synthase [Dehalococcoidia bacterium]|nr:riboflavin synthase [Dehalococcoidia bacterium]
MFTGIIEEVGAVLAVEGARLTIGARRILDDLRPGDSVAVNGVDVTATSVDDRGFTCDLMPETLRRSNLGELRPGDPVNLERSVTPSTRLSGHLVRGVVEATGRIASVEPEGDALLVRVEAPPEILRYVIVKGPIAVDGISLTVTARDDHSFTVSLVQYTQEHTTLARKRPGETVNLETDIIARYVEQLLGERLAAQAAAGAGGGS